jgi:hypothetical protein
MGSREVPDTDHPQKTEAIVSLITLYDSMISLSKCEFR